MVYIGFESHHDRDLHDEENYHVLVGYLSRKAEIVMNHGEYDSSVEHQGPKVVEAQMIV